MLQIFIKNMEYPDCRKVIETQMRKIGITFKALNANEVELDDNISKQQVLDLQLALIPNGLAFIINKKSRLIEKTKLLIRDFLNSSNEKSITELFDYIQEKMKCRISYLNKIFLEETETTIDNYYSSKKIEKINILLQGGGMSLTKIEASQYKGHLRYMTQLKNVS